MNFFTSRNYKVLLVIFCLAFYFNASAQRIASVSGPWSSTVTWGGAAVPTAGQTVVINNGISVTVDIAAVCSSLTVNTGNAASAVTINGTNSLTITGAITIDPSTTNGVNKIIAVGAGTLTCGSLTMTGSGQNTRLSLLTITIGTATVSGNIVMPGTNVIRNQVNITGAGRLNVFGGFTGGTFTTATGSIVDYYGAAQTIRTETYSNLILSGSNTKSVPANCTATANLTISAGVTLQPTADINFTLGGNLSNAGSLNSDNGGSQMDFIFNGTTDQSVSGAGALTEFNRITINSSNAANIVEFMPTNFTAAAGFLTLTRGIIKMSGTYNFTNTFFNTAGPTINADEGIWLNNPNVTVTGQDGNTQLSGLLRITDGTYNVGNSNTRKLLYFTGSSITIEGGALNVSGALGGSGIADITTYNQSGGTVTVAINGNNQGWGSFEIYATGSTFIMSGGTIVIEELSTIFPDYWNNSTNATVTGGTLQIGNTSTPTPTFNYWISTTPPIYNLVVNTTNSPTAEMRTNVMVLNDVTIGTGAGLDASTLNNNLTVGRHFTNNGTFTQRAATVTFNGSTVLQTIGGTNNTTFYNFTANNTFGPTTTGITLLRPTTVTNILTLTSGHITTTSNLLTMNAGSSVNTQDYVGRISGGSANSFINGPMRKIGGTAFLFPVGKLTRGIRYCGISGTTIATDAFDAEFISGSASNLSGGISNSAIKHVSKCEYWTIGRTAGGSSTNVTLSWNPASICNAAAYVTQLSSLVVAHYGTSWDSYGNDGGNTGTVSSGSVTWNGVSTFSPFSLGSTSASENPLPVKLVNVKAYHTGGRNRIEWTNLTEIDVVAYEVERSLNGTQFTSMASLAARSNANDKESYYEYDVQPAAVTYYRIKVTSRDGEIVYSPIVKVVTNLTVQQDIVLYPNPVTGKQFTIQMNSAAGDYYVKIFSANGQIVKTETLKHPGGAYAKTIELPGQLQAGQYYMQVSGGEKILTSKFIVQ